MKPKWQYYISTDLRQRGPLALRLDTTKGSEKYHSVCIEKKRGKHTVEWLNMGGGQYYARYQIDWTDMKKVSEKEALAHIEKRIKYLKQNS